MIQEVQTSKSSQLNKIFVGRFILSGAVIILFTMLILNLTERVSVMQDAISDLNQKTNMLLNTHIELEKREKFIDQMIKKFESIPQTSSESELKKAHKFELLKLIALIEKDVDHANIKRLNNILSDERLSIFVNDPQSIQSNKEIIYQIKEIINNSDKQPHNNDIYDLIFKFVKIQSIEKFNQHNKTKDILNNMISAAHVKDLNLTHDITIDDNQLELIMAMLDKRIKFVSVLSDIKNEVMSDD